MFNITAVRFGRVPKREKAKIMEQMQKVNIQCHGSMLDAVLSNESELQRQIVEAHMKTCEFTRANFDQFYQKAWAHPDIVHCPAHMVRHSQSLEKSIDEHWGMHLITSNCCLIVNS